MNTTIPIRVTVLDTLDDVSFDFPADTTLAEVKRSALAQSKIRSPAADFVLKYQGAELFEEGRTLAQAGVLRNSALIALRRIGDIQGATGAIRVAEDRWVLHITNDTNIGRQIFAELPADSRRIGAASISQVDQLAKHIRQRLIDRAGLEIVE